MKTNTDLTLFRNTHPMLDSTESDQDQPLDAYRIVDKLIARQDTVLEQLEQLQIRIEDEIKRVVDSRSAAVP